MTTTTRESYDQVMMPNYAPGDVIPVRGCGSRVWDQAGTESVSYTHLTLPTNREV